MKKNPLVMVPAVIIGAVVGYWVVGGIFNGANFSFDQTMVQTANQLK